MVGNKAGCWRAFVVGNGGQRLEQAWAILRRGPTPGHA